MVQYLNAPKSDPKIKNQGNRETKTIKWKYMF